MRRVADDARETSLADARAAIAAKIAAMRASATARSDELRNRAEQDVTGIGDWSRAEIVRIEAETQRKIEQRRAQLAEQLDEHDRRSSAEIAALEAQVEQYEGELALFFAQLGEITDPDTFISAARRMPRLPTPMPSPTATRGRLPMSDESDEAVGRRTRGAAPRPGHRSQRRHRHGRGRGRADQRHRAGRRGQPAATTDQRPRRRPHPGLRPPPSPGAGAEHRRRNRGHHHHHRRRGPGKLRRGDLVQVRAREGRRRHRRAAEPGVGRRVHVHRHPSRRRRSWSMSPPPPSRVRPSSATRTAWSTSAPASTADPTEGVDSAHGADREEYPSTGRQRSRAPAESPRRSERGNVAREPFGIRPIARM